MGRTAVGLLLEQIEQPDPAPRDVLLPYQLVVRRTCGAAGR